MKKSHDSEKMIREDIVGMRPYVPITSIEVLSEQIGIPVEKIIKLDGNENPYGCSNKAQQALAKYPYYHIYPDPEQRELRESLEKYTEVPAENILTGSGSDELIELIIRLFISPGDKIINCTPTFGMYSFLTEVYAGKVIEVPRDNKFAIDIETVKNSTKTGVKLIFIASPNNPSGNTVSEQEVMELLETGIMLIIDEAYFEFSGETMISLINKYDNLIVLRTFSKWAGVAGLRVGYGCFPSKIIGHLMKIKQPYNVNVAAQIAAIETLKDTEYRQRSISAILRERERLYSELEGLETIEPLPSKANFILCRVRKGNAFYIHRELQKRGIFIRHFGDPQLENYLRISIGKPEHTAALITALKEICLMAQEK